MYTLNQLINRLKTHASNHAQVNSFGFGDPADIGEKKLLYGGMPGEVEPSNAVKYPLEWCNVTGSDIQPNVHYFELELIHGDLLSRDRTNEAEVLSDRHSVLLDMITLLVHDADLYNLFAVEILSKPVPFTEPKLDDGVAGWSHKLRIKIPVSYNNCEIPTIATEAPALFDIVNGGLDEVLTDVNEINLISG